MNRLWAPWRKAYIRPKEKKEKACVFCRLIAAPSSRDAKNYILLRSSYNFAILNLYPYNNGHVMIVPTRHVDRIEKLSDAEKLDWLDLYAKVQQAIEKSMNPHGFNVGMNLGRVAGAGIPNHMHLHLVPRWQGDANFMPVVGATKIISESLDSAHRTISKALGALASKPKSLSRKKD